METNPEIEGLEALRVQFIEELDTYVAIIQSEEYEGDPLDIDPFSMGFDDDIIDNLPSWEQSAIEEELYGFLGIGQNPSIVENYMTEVNEEEKLAVSMLATDKEGVFLHEILYTDGTKRWRLGSRDHI